MCPLPNLLPPATRAFAHVALRRLRDAVRGGCCARPRLDRSDDDAAMLWFVTAGVCIALLGLACRAIEAGGHTVPREIGIGLVALGALISAMMPVSGGWLVMAIGGLALIRAQRTRVAAG